MAIGFPRPARRIITAWKPGKRQKPSLILLPMNGRRQLTHSPNPPHPARQTVPPTLIQTVLTTLGATVSSMLTRPSAALNLPGLVEQGLGDRPADLAAAAAGLLAEQAGVMTGPRSIPRSGG